ncbi:MULTISPECIES: hybrid sensor histidine kinase/response regulator [unclassified Pseudomonas]|uniref:hybrid sensor histidine kinase/response regulator n=1 Tax=unclassified Pseudomonas TaxID=196821 RepID=UPI00244C0CFB|nr:MULTISPECIES: hybrid sensor histidine kinase/response regulator [unclassified Pseudomonas]MDG9924304.1 ATP-binding protein [Pseudomonas sp. GD04045]MDH0033345.1 ATP-binding protein [Pseudomonas sp. GD04019]
MPAEGRLQHCWRMICLCCLLTLAGSAWAEVQDLRDDSASQPLESFDLRLDQDGSLDIAAVVASPEHFVPVTAQTQTHGFDPRPRWLRLNLRNPGPIAISRWLEIGHARLESAKLYMRDGDGPWQVLASGLRVPMAARPLPGPNALFPLTLQPGETRTFYLRIQTQSAQYLEPRLWAPHAYHDKQLRVENLRSMALGGIVLTGLLSLLIFIQLREAPYLYFGLEMFLISAFEAVMGGLAQQYLWPSTWAFPLGLVPLLGAGMAIMHCQFVRTFLDLKRLGRGWDRAQIAVTVVVVAAALAANLHQYIFWIQVLSLCALLTLGIGITTSYLAWRAGNASARLTLISFATFAATVLVREAGMYLGFDPTGPTLASALPWAVLVMAPIILIAIANRTQQLTAALAVEREANRAKTTFLAHMSHELRTPLNTIIGFAQLLQRGSRRLSLEEGARAIEGSGRHLLHLIDELLDAARAEIGQLDVMPTPLAFRPWLADMVEVARLQAEAAGNSFSLEEQGVVPEYLSIDSRRLRQVLDNLFSNANRYTRNGRISLRYHGEKQGSQVRLFFAVEDSGGGIAANDLPNIFQPFVRGSNQVEGSRNGVGLGLAIARQLVHCMGGELIVASTPGQGSAFRFHVVGELLTELPADPIAAETAALHPEGAQSVLLVEDDPDLRLLLSEQLSRHQLKVVTAVNGRDAANQWREDIALVITDQFMEGGDGWSVLQMVAERDPAIPVVLISAAAPLAPEDFAPHLKFAACLKKPVSETDLASLLGTFLGLHDLASTTREPIASTTAARPDAARLAILAGLVETGQITLIEEWAHELAAEQPRCTGFADAVLQAALTLDFPQLATLAEAAE